MWRGTGCDSSTALKGLVNAPPELSARSFQDVVAAGCAGCKRLQLYCNNCEYWFDVKVTPAQVLATGGEFEELIYQLAIEHDCGGTSFVLSENYSWQKFFNEAWASLKASRDYERALAEYDSHSIFGLVCIRVPLVCAFPAACNQ
jgi:hypothetical protein